MNILEVMERLVSDKQPIRLNNSYYYMTDQVKNKIEVDHFGRVTSTKKVPIIKKITVQNNTKANKFFDADTEIFSLEEILNTEWQLDTNIEALQELPESRVEKTAETALIGDLIGIIITSIQKEDDVLRFYTEDGTYEMHHEQDCCEDVHIESIDGDLEDLIGTPILKASEEVSVFDSADETWTFYKLATIKGYVAIRWHGSSNGYYSEKVSLFFTPK